ncbi:MAG: hypothetical protein ACP5VP_02665 [Candidatus Limnocylindrales bacterium]
MGRDPKKLARLADSIELDLERLLALTEQLSAAPRPPARRSIHEPAARPDADLAGVIAALDAQTAALESLARSTAGLTEAQYRLNDAVTRLVAALSAVLATPIPPPADGGPG